MGTFLFSPHKTSMHYVQISEANDEKHFNVHISETND